VIGFTSGDFGIWGSTMQGSPGEVLGHRPGLNGRGNGIDHQLDDIERSQRQDALDDGQADGQGGPTPAGLPTIMAKAIS